MPVREIANIFLGDIWKEYRTFVDIYWFAQYIS